ncbi:hypothetical protein QNH36_12775 [Mesobacillus sp. AQ2]|jgi:hypothetical protein|uniref:hypothetical protein n=1 Tax=Bacillaceae TaxID=186817 RepID=UPI0011A8A305|nr:MULTISPECIES: hypothetical protein [Bacillaceae]MCM3121641.1 hypothetical protein [Mesobacillus sp. MER 33]MCM3231605.1 hypothetical protein [Mesobacillus sp. MER 48]WHX38577.1 hypothetical protein QNH36_12775 [Mesobacillus sp. AQ2]
MKKLMMVCTLLLSILFTSFHASAAETEIPKGAQDFADTHFKNIVLDTVKGDTPGSFNFTPSENITFGPLLKIYVMGKDFYVGKKKGSEGIVDANEYISVVYQDGKPVNAISTYLNEAGAYDLAIFGYPYEDVKELAKIKENESLLYNMENELWFVYNGKKVKGLNKAGKDLLKTQEKSIEDYQSVIVDMYEGKVGTDTGQDGAKGSILAQYNPENNNLLYTLYGAVAVLGAACAYLVIKNRKLKAVK